MEYYVKYWKRILTIIYDHLIYKNSKKFNSIFLFIFYLVNYILNCFKLTIIHFIWMDFNFGRCSFTKSEYIV